MEMIETIAHSIYPLSKSKPIILALHIINEDVSNHIKLKQLAKRVGTNECTLKKGFRSLLNISVYQYLLKSRMMKATQLLQHSRLKQKDIAYQCGYESLAAFVTAFGKYFGQTPGEYRKKILSLETN